MTAHKSESMSRPSNGYDKGSKAETQLDASAGLTQEQRNHMIAEAAYYMAEHRNFQGGDPVHDWLQAQMEVDSNIDGSYRLRTHSN